jgi:hypothetical protein
VKKYYTEQRNSDASARDVLKAPVRRREREAKERQAEIDMMESMYRVGSAQLSSKPTESCVSPCMMWFGSLLVRLCRPRSSRSLHSYEPQRRMM